VSFERPLPVPSRSCRPVHSSTYPPSPFEVAWATQPIVRHSDEDLDLETIAKESTPKDKRHAADLLFQRKKKAYHSKCALWWTLVRGDYGRTYR